MLDTTHDGSSQDSRIVKLQREEFKICKARLIERQTQLIEYQIYRILIKPKARENV